MIRNYFKIAWRNLLRNKVSSTINISGLTIGMTAFMLILLYIQDELKFDLFLDKADRIYQVDLNASTDGQEIFIGKTPASVSAALARNFPEIGNTTRVYRPGDLVLRSLQDGKENFFTESTALAVDTNFLEVFPFFLQKGNRASCLRDPNSIVISERMALKYFGTADVVGKNLLINKERRPVVISGVLENIPSRSTLQFDILAPISAFPIVKKMSWSWVWLQVCTYVRLKDGIPNQPEDLRALENKFPAMVRTEAGPAFKRVGKPFDELIKKGGKWQLRLQPYTDIHLHSAGIGQVMSNISDIRYVYAFSAIALFILILACVNFMNLSTAQSSTRAKEVGLRKVLGSEKKFLVTQFLVEALVFSFAAFACSMFLAAFLLPFFNNIAGKDLEFGSLLTLKNLFCLCGLFILTGLLAGSYPAFYLASFKPVTTLKSIKTPGKGFADFFVRNSLVVFQFTVSTVLIICTMIVHRQLQFMQNKDLGLNKDGVIVISNADRLGTGLESFRSELEQTPGVFGVSIASGFPTRENFGDGYVPQPASANDQPAAELGLSSFMVDESFIPALGIKVLEGRNFSKDFSDSASVILNEEAVKRAGWKGAVGSYMTYPGNRNQQFKVIGIVKDFNVTSLHSPVNAFALFHSSSRTYNLGTSYILVKSRPGYMGDLPDILRKKWGTFAGSTPFDFSFLDREFDVLYRAEQRTGHALFIFTSLAIFVACLGLLGLAVFSAERRTKEIGVRKVLGASAGALVALLSKDFVKPVLLAGFIAFPMAWYIMDQWLRDFAYHISITWQIFFKAGALSVIIAVVTVSFQTVRTAFMNPIKSLRTE